MSLTFAEAQFLVSLVAGIQPEKGETFRSRLKQWQKMGFPEGTKVGRGVKAQYGARQILQLVLLVKLLRIGLTPERAQSVIKEAWTRFMGGFVEALICMSNGEDHLHYFTIQLDALSELTTPGGSDHMHAFVDVFTDTEMLMAWDEPDDDWTEEERQQQAYSSFLVKNRMAVSIIVEIDSLLVWIWAGLEVLKKGPEVFADEFADWERLCREIDFQSQPSQEHFDTDAHNQSIALRPNGIDRVAAAGAALLKVPKVNG
ncbi:hypothetical protein CVO77_03575 [Sphingopyxis lindanitolerans]|uniref:Uncharacterized protein n=1 Tax=Sphingopyxis lindanitolerans TaxID=2054227 RepID=A0A2S8B5P7_9SPHN|nr:hypothetical protein [Sphingopyxis lindanitolerans]PQM27663.1 hypothetical protein CVO77_03575 [Sphingopyxis lindanitolerans]